MAGAGKTKGDVEFHGRLVAGGCIACIIDARVSGHHLQIHHPEGRNKGRAGDYSERYAICLCAEHHDRRIYWGYYNGGERVLCDPDIPSVHHAKREFTSRYGSERYLVHFSYELLGEQPVWLTHAEWHAFLTLDDLGGREDYLLDILRPEVASERRAKHAAN